MLYKVNCIHCGKDFIQSLKLKDKMVSKASPYFHIKCAKQYYIPLCCAIFYSFIWNPLFSLLVATIFFHYFGKYNGYSASGYVHCPICTLLKRHSNRKGLNNAAI